MINDYNNTFMITPYKSNRYKQIWWKLSQHARLFLGKMLKGHKLDAHARNKQACISELNQLALLKSRSCGGDGWRLMWIKCAHRKSFANNKQRDCFDLLRLVDTVTWQIYYVNEPETVYEITTRFVNESRNRKRWTKTKMKTKIANTGNVIECENR